MRIRPLGSLGLAPGGSGRRAVQVIVLPLLLVRQDLIGLSHKMEHELGFRRMVVVLKMEVIYFPLQF